MIYLVVGLDQKMLSQWHANVMADDAASATRIAQARAAAQGTTLVVAAVIGPNLEVV